MQTSATPGKTKTSSAVAVHKNKQQSFFAPQRIQRTPTSGSTVSPAATPPIAAGGSTATPATETEVRLMVAEATQLLIESIDFFQLARVDDATLERVLNSWIGMANIYPGLIATRLNNDAALLQSFQTAFNNAVRTLFTRRAAQQGASVSVISLYLRNLYRLPSWSWPEVASFNLTNETQRRAFVTSYTTALNESSLFQGFTVITTEQLESVLSYLFTLTTNTQNILAANLSNDATLVVGLKMHTGLQ